MNSIKSMPKSEHLLIYPQDDGFNELLNYCGSMTKQLESLGHHLSITVLAERHTKVYFERYITLNLNQTPVIIALSKSKISDNFFYSLLKNANITPIGKFLFAPQSQAQRLPDMEIKLIDIHNTVVANSSIIKHYLSTNYHIFQQFWLRSSKFTYLDQELKLTEIVLPEVNLFFNT